MSGYRNAAPKNDDTAEIYAYAVACAGGPPGVAFRGLIKVLAILLLAAGIFAAVDLDIGVGLALYASVHVLVGLILSSPPLARRRLHKRLRGAGLIAPGDPLLDPHPSNER